MGQAGRPVSKIKKSWQAYQLSPERVAEGGTADRKQKAIGNRPEVSRFLIDLHSQRSQKSGLRKPAIVQSPRNPWPPGLHPQK